MMNDTISLNIILADDDQDDCLFFKDALEELALDASLTTVHDGEQLIQLLTKEERAQDFAPLPDVLFLDLNMPRKNGFACLTEIKHSEKLKALPVIIFSTSYDEEKAKQLYDSGAHYYICKPSDFLHLKKVIHQVITLLSKEKNVQPPKEMFVLSNLKSILF